MDADQLRAAALDILAAQDSDFVVYFTLLAKLADALGSGMHDTARRLAQLAGE